MKKVLMLMLVFSLLLIFCACGNQPEEPENLPVETTVQQTETQMQESDWERFRAYLQEKGDAVVETDRSTSGKYLVSQVVIKGKEDKIQIVYKCESIVTLTNASAGANQIAKVDFPEGSRNVQVEIQYEVTGREGGHTRTQSCDTTYTWNIEAYEEGDEIKFTADYTDVDENGKSLKQEGTMLSFDATRGFGDITDALRKVLAESGLGITMADLGFVNY